MKKFTFCLKRIVKKIHTVTQIVVKIFLYYRECGVDLGTKLRVALILNSTNWLIVNFLNHWHTV